MNWDLLVYLLENFSISKKKNLNFAFADCIMLLEETSEDLPDTVYIVADAVPDRHFVKALLIYPNRPGAKRTRIISDNYICTESGTKAMILNRLLKTQAYLNMFSARLSAARTNQEALEIANSCTGAPYFYFDASYRVLSIIGNVDMTKDPEWKHMVEKGFCSPEAIKQMQDSGDLDMLADKQEPCLYKAGFFPFSSLVCNIWLNGRFYSRLNMLGLQAAPDEINKQECRILCDNLLRIAQSSGENANYTGPLNHMFMDLLKGLSLSEELIHDRLNLMPQLRSCLLQVCCIETRIGNDPQVLRYYSGLTERLFTSDPALTLEYEDNVVLLFYAKEVAGFEPLFQKLSGLLQTQGLHCGVSNLFYRFSQLHYFYLQALTALNGKHPAAVSGPVFFYRDIYFGHLISCIPREQALSMVSYKLHLLHQLQPDYQFPLADTLRIYLECGCNLQKTADKLCIHKNTALYRINHIRQLLDSDLEDINQRAQLWFSFRILDAYPPQYYN